MNNCLICYLPLAEKGHDYHPHCSKKMFGHTIPPKLNYTDENLGELAKEIIQNKSALTGVQSKISLQIHVSEKAPVVRKFTIVGLWGGYILKPPTSNYPQLPEVEDATMHLAKLTKIKTVPHCLVRLETGNLAYLTKRVDRNKNGKLAMEDMCQLTERLTENKYNGSYEQIGKTILQYSATPGLDIVNFFEILLFCFLTGNADMHLKNFSLLETIGLGMVLSPAYDLVNTRLVNPADTEEMALTLNGRKKNLKLADFFIAMNTLKLEKQQQQNIFKKMQRAFPKWNQFIDSSFLTNEFKAEFKSIILERMNRLKLIE